MPARWRLSLPRPVWSGVLVAFLLMLQGYAVYAHPPTKGVKAKTFLPLSQATGTWQQIATTNAPPARRDAALGYDLLGHRLILFGGRNETGALGDTWALDLATGVWQPLITDTAVRPDARYSMVSGVETTHHQFLVTTGQAPGTLFNDVWSFDLTTNIWGEVAMQGAIPEGRYGSAGGIAPEGDRFWLSHGFTEAGRFDDTRHFDVATHTWQNVTPPHNRPLPRCLHAATLTPNSDMVLFGGCASGFGPCPLNDTWLFEATTDSWSEIATPDEVEARLFPGLVTLGTHNDLLLFGGEAGSNRFGDGWVLDMASREWTEVVFPGKSPVARAGHQLVWIPALPDAPQGAALLFGGQGDAGYLNDIWLYVPAPESTPLPVSLYLPTLWRQ